MPNCLFKYELINLETWNSEHPGDYSEILFFTRLLGDWRFIQQIQYHETASYINCSSLEKNDFINETSIFFYSGRFQNIT